MIQQSSRTCMGFVAAVLLVGIISTTPHFASADIAIGVNISTDLTSRLGGTNTGIYYPLYSLSELPQVLAAKKAFPNVPFNVNINPASGPGSGPSTSWTSAITQLKNAGAVVTGYVPTAYGTGRTISNVEGMISSYNQFYPGMLDGIMFDEVSGSCTQTAFYTTISNYARSLGYNYIRANPGSSICQADVPLFNHIAIYESGGYPSESTLSSRTYYPQYSKDVVGFGTTIYTTSTYDPTWLHMAVKYLKWVYITDQTEPNLYAVFPSYFNQYLTDLSSLAGTTTPPPTAPPGSPTGLTATATSTSQINLSWTAPSGTVSGYKIERSTSSSAFSTIVSNTGSTATTYSNTGLSSATQYTYRVSAINSVGASSPSGTASATTLTQSTTLSLTVNSIDLSGSPLTGMWVELNDSSGSRIASGFTPTTFSVTSGVQYTVHAANWQNIVFNHWNDGNTSPARIIVPTQTTTLTAYYSTGSTTTSPGSPTGLAATATSTSQINLSWTAPSGTVSGYKIERSTDGGSTWSSIVSNTGSTATTYSNTGLSSATQYTYRVSAINSVGASSPSGTASATTLTQSTTLSLTVNSIDLSGSPLTGMWVKLNDSSGSRIASG